MKSLTIETMLLTASLTLMAAPAYAKTVRSKKWLIGAVALTASLWLPTTLATAATITLSGTAVVEDVFAEFDLNIGDTFTYSIDIDGSVPDSGTGIAVLADFDDPVRSIEIAGQDLGSIIRSEITFRERFMAVFVITQDSFGFELALDVESGWLVGDSYELDQLTLLPDNWSFALGGFAFLDTDGEAAVAENLSVAVELEVPAVPLPAAGWMLLGGLGLLAAAGRRRTGRQTAREPAPRSLPGRRCQRPPSDHSDHTPPTACLAPKGAL